jgi:Cu(I)/Ag(I) efflux system membrane protein CusA/SilA
MIAHLIRWSVRNRFFVLIGMLALIGAGVWAVRSTAIDALPDLSDVQVVIRTSYLGQAPRIVENQVTYPLTTTMLSVPGAKTVRGYSFFGDSFVYVIFEDGTDLYWARSRVLEYLNQVQGRLPPARAAPGPDARAWAGSMNMRWSTDQAATICRNCAAFRTGSCATN